MWINYFSLQNYRSYDKKQEIYPKQGLNIIIGKNNAGKSNLLKSLRNRDFSEANIFRGNNSLSSMILSCKLTQSEINQIIENRRSLHLSEFAKREGKTFKITKESFIRDLLKLPIVNLKDEIIYLGPFYVNPIGNEIKFQRRGEFNRFANEEIRKKLIQIDKRLFSEEWDDFFNKNRLSDEETQEILKSLSEDKQLFFNRINANYKDPEEKFANQILFRYEKEFQETLSTIRKNFQSLDDNIIFFNEVRIRANNSPIKPNFVLGHETAQILFRLFVSRNNQDRILFNKILKAFQRLFPENIITVAMNEKNKPEIYVNDEREFSEESNSIGQKIEDFGMGLYEALTLFVNIYSKKGKIFLIEEPELHLHPSQQRVLKQIFHEQSEHNQFFITTHSPYFINIDDISANTIVRKTNGSSKITSIKTISKNLKLNAYRIFQYEHPENLELFFADKVLLVEGPTEKICIPYLFSQTERNHNIQNIFIANVNGKGKLPAYHKLLCMFEIPHLILCDEDAKDELLGKKINENLLIIMEPDIEGPICNHPDFRLEYHILKNVEGKGKPMSLFLILKEIIEDQGFEVIPKEYINIINRIEALKH